MVALMHFNNRLLVFMIELFCVFLFWNILIVGSDQRQLNETSSQQIQPSLLGMKVGDDDSLFELVAKRPCCNNRATHNFDRLSQKRLREPPSKPCERICLQHMPERARTERRFWL